MMINKFKGLICPVVTPFDGNGDIDENLFIKEVEYLSSTGIHGLSPGGSTGEGAFLTVSEIARLVTLIKQNNVKKLPIVAGIIRNSTRDAVEAGLAAKEAGADALMVTPASYNILVPDDDGNYDFYKQLSDSVSLPLIIYNVVPQNEISTELYLRLLNIENVIGIKQSVGGIKALYDKILSAKSLGASYAATDDMLFTSFELGADGAIAAILTLFPEICSKMWTCALNDDHETGLALQNKIYPIWQKIIGPHFPRRIKIALTQINREPGLTRSPITGSNPIEIEEISMAINAFQK